MRIQPWMTAVAGALMLLATQTPSSAQTPYVPGPYQGGGGGPYVPPAPYPNGVDPNVMYPPGLMPNDFQPWPEVSPFYPANVAQQSTYNRNGLWFKDILFRKREMTFSVEGMMVQYKDPGNAFIGSPVQRPMPWDLFLPLTNPQDPTTGPFFDFDPGGFTGPGWLLLTPYTYPWPALSDTDGTITSNVGNNNFPLHSANHMGPPGMEGGLQLRLSAENGDRTGMMWSGFFTQESITGYTRGRDNLNGFPITQDLLLLMVDGGGIPILVSPSFGNIPLNNGEPFNVPIFGPGSTAKYDVLFDMQFRTETAGTNVNWYHQPFYHDGARMLRPLFGLRYMYLHETFGFRGIDSGFNYTVDEDTNRPEGAPEVLYEMYEATLNSEVKSHLAGPEIGIRFDLGHDSSGFKVWGESIFGLHANAETINVYGDNIGDPLYDVRINGQLVPRMLDPANNSEFNTKKTTTHISPLFQQSIFADMDLFSAIPVLKDIDLLEESTFRIGYTFVWIGAVARPADSIAWRGFPLFPGVQSNRTSWFMQQLNASVDIHF